MLLLRRTRFAGHTCHIECLVPGRALRVTAVRDNFAVSFVAAHIYADDKDDTGSPLAALGAIASAFRSLGALPHYFMADWNFLERGESYHRADGSDSEQRDTGLRSCFEARLPYLTELHQPEDTWMRSGLAGRLDRVFSSYSPVLLAGKQLLAYPLWSLHSLQAAVSDHAPICVEVLAERRHGCGIPRWCFAHPAYEQFAQQLADAAEVPQGSIG